MNRKIYSILVAIIITIAFVAILFSQIELSNVIEMLSKTNPIYILAGFVFQLTNYILRAKRIQILLNKKISVNNLFSIVCIHNMALNFFPARSGEISHIYLLNKRHEISVGEGATSLIITRILDIITISILFFIFALTAHNLPSKIFDTAIIIAIILFFIIILILIFIKKSDRFIDRLRIISIILNINERHLVNYLFRKMSEMSASFKKLTFDRFIWCVILSILIWILSYLTIIINIKAIGISIAFESLLLALSLFLIVSFIPIQGIGGFGTLEGAWAISFMSVGVAKEFAISSGFVIHIIIFSYLCMLFLIGFIRFQKNK